MRPDIECSLHAVAGLLRTGRASKGQQPLLGCFLPQTYFFRAPGGTGPLSAGPGRRGAIKLRCYQSPVAAAGVFRASLTAGEPWGAFTAGKRCVCEIGTFSGGNCPFIVSHFALSYLSILIVVSL